jgi:hypothetical protein
MIKRVKKYTGMEAVDQARYWVKEAEGDYDEAVELARRYERGRVRQKDVIAAIDFLSGFPLALEGRHEDR